ncbi:hypothetical protein [Spiroplasma sp. SV19]|uniref:hypothetical protein n=1 Tax=Spiroplasma sp. SV19 TaxID=2570468 RepID=UPI0024B841BC|nr:hypothetical protein [Spiroplasma sp. SV19]WHQ36397.1 hypothetical protein E7Y35_00345 [Spiroplasma sp. SV19]
MSLQTGMSALCCLSIMLLIYEIIVFVKWDKTCRRIWSKYLGKWLKNKNEQLTEISKLNDDDTLKAKKEIRMRLIFNLVVLSLATVGTILFGVLVYVS